MAGILRGETARTRHFRTCEVRGAVPTMRRSKEHRGLLMQLSASIFKAYDIRGIVPTTLDAEVAEALGRAFGSAARAAGERAVAVGRDGRLSGPALADALIRGPRGHRRRGDRHRRRHHAHAVLRGQHAGHQRHSGHGQPQPQGLQRLQDGAGRPRHLRRRSRLCARSWKTAAPRSPMAAVCARSTLSAYVERIVGDIKLQRPLKIVVDSATASPAPRHPRSSAPSAAVDKSR